jgi:hypothetical protein
MMANFMEALEFEEGGSGLSRHRRMRNLPKVVRNPGVIALIRPGLSGLEGRL